MPEALETPGASGSCAKQGGHWGPASIPDANMGANGRELFIPASQTLHFSCRCQSCSQLKDLPETGCLLLPLLPLLLLLLLPLLPLLLLLLLPLRPLLLLLPLVTHFLQSCSQLTPRISLRASKVCNCSQRCNGLWASVPGYRVQTCSV